MRAGARESERGRQRLRERALQKLHVYTVAVCSKLAVIMLASLFLHFYFTIIGTVSGYKHIFSNGSWMGILILLFMYIAIIQLACAWQADLRHQLAKLTSEDTGGSRRVRLCLLLKCIAGLTRQSKGVLGAQSIAMGMLCGMWYVISETACACAHMTSTFITYCIRFQMFLKQQHKALISWHSAA